MAPEFTDVVEKRFSTSGAPVVRIENVAGETRVRGSAGDEVVVRASKRTHAESAERGKRVLDNIDIEIEQEGDEIRVSQRAFLIERGWANLFRERRATVDYDIDVPVGATVAVRSASGEIEVGGVTGGVELQTVSGDLVVRDVRGQVRLRSVSGDCTVESCAGPVEANSVSGDLGFHGCAWPTAHVRTISGDVDAEVRLEGRGPVVVNTVSGDLELASPSAMEVTFDTTSGDLDAEGMTISKVGRRSYVARQGEQGADVRVHTVSGDVTLRHADVSAPDVPETVEMPPSPPGRDRKAEALEVLRALEKGEIDAERAAQGAGLASPSVEGREVLRLLAEKKIDAEQAYRLLVALGDLGAPERPREKGESRPFGPHMHGHGGPSPRTLRIRVTEGGHQKVNMAIPLSLARVGRVAGLSRVISQFGIDLREVARDVGTIGKVVDVVDEDGSRVEIYVE